MSGTTDPGADPRLRFDAVDMFCACSGQGVPVNAADAGAGWWLVTWLTAHAPGCAGRAAPERAYLVNVAALARGDVDLPGVEADYRRRRP